MSRNLTRRSESQSMADYGRSATYADDNARSWQVQFDRPTHEPKHLSGYVRELRDAYEAEVPSRLHRHDVDGGGTPAFTAAFEAWLWGSPYTLDHETGMYTTPLRACIAGMARSSDARTQSRARIAYAVIVGCASPAEAASRDGVPMHWGEVVALDALRVTWRRLTRGPIPMPQRDAVA